MQQILAVLEPLYLSILKAPTKSLRLVKLGLGWGVAGKG